MSKPTFLPEVALRIAKYAYEKAIEEFQLDAGFYGIQQAAIEGRKCLIISIVIAKHRAIVDFSGFQKHPGNQSAVWGSSHLFQLFQIRSEDKTDEPTP